MIDLTSLFWKKGIKSRNLFAIQSSDISLPYSSTHFDRELKMWMLSLPDWKRVFLCSASSSVLGLCNCRFSKWKILPGKGTAAAIKSRAASATTDTRHLTPPNGIREGKERENPLIKFPQIPSAKRGRNIPRSRALLPSVVDSDQESGFYAGGLVAGLYSS